MSITSLENTSSTPKDAAHVAAEWWGEQLCKSIPDEPGGALEEFTDRLVERIQQLLQREDGRPYRVMLNVDRTPDPLLARCAEEAHLQTDPRDWPQKTMMVVTSEDVYVSTYGISEMMRYHRKVR